MNLRVGRAPIAIATLIAATHLLVHAQATTPVAIVGARIVDGSGNDPFVGTVLIDGGRIRAVGRTVEVPPGAESIDGSGKTLLPGLIDVLVHVDAAPARTASALAAALYAGVTTVGASGLPPERFDAIRGDSGRPDSATRALLVGAIGATDADAGAAWARVFRGAPVAALIAAGAPGADAAAADARSRGFRLFVDLPPGGAIEGAAALNPHVIVGTPSAGDPAVLAALVAKNVTMAPDLLAAAPAAALTPESVSPDLAELADRAGAPPAAGDAARWAAAGKAVAALRDARVRLAVTSRAGQPLLSPGLGTHAAVKLLVEAGLTPLQAVTAATSGGAWALNQQSDRGFLAPGMRADLVLVQGDPTTAIGDLARVERVWLGGAAVERTALLAKARPPAPPPPSAPTPETPAAAEAKEVPAPAPAPAAGRRRRGAKSAPRATESAPAVARAEPGPGAAGAAPEAAAPGAAAAETSKAGAEASESPAEAPASRIENGLLDDFEQGDERSVIGPRWQSGSGEGSTPATIVMGRVVRGLRDHALHLTARMGEGRDPFVRASIALGKEGGPVDVSRFRGIRFDARGEGRYRIVFVTRGVTDGRHYESYFSGSPNWTPVGIPFASIGQNGRGSQLRFSGRDLIEVRFEVARDSGRMAWLELDNIRFY